MIVAPCTADEHERLEALRRYGILGTAAEADFDAITALLSVICETPIALVSLVDRDRQWFKSRVGLEATETHRDLAFCAHAILQDGVLVVADATKDERFADNPLVLEDPKIRFYAGAPLVTPEKLAIGTLCAIDTRPRTLSAGQILALKTLSSHVVNLLELRLQLTASQRLNQALTDSQQALELANWERSQFFANINHEMRTPLSAILGFTRRLQARTQTDTVPVYVNDGLNMIASSAERLRELVDDVLDISKIDAGKMELSMQVFDPAVLLQDVVGMVDIKAQERNITLRSIINENVQLKVCGDARKTAQILLNLLSNAVKFTPSNQQVTASCDYLDDHLIFTIQDEGVGIPESDLSRIFQPFEQSSIPSQSDTKGTGLGLSIVKAFVELMRGKIDVISEINVGTTFTVRLPMPTT